jgi:hypothetical protein
MKRGACADKPNLGGRPPFTPTDDQREMVTRLAALLVPREEIARDWFSPPICRDTLCRYFRAELSRGQSRTTARLRLRILRAAENGSLRAAFYLLDRLCPEFAQARRAAQDPPPPATTTIVIRGGLPNPIERSAG